MRLDISTSEQCNACKTDKNGGARSELTLGEIKPLH